MMGSIYDLILYFTLYSVVGWVCESIFVSVGTRKATNRGFLAGPYCPIYGFGGLLILFVCEPLKAWPPLVFLAALVAASALEYFTGWLLETLFKARWWDYSKRFLNIKGRVCLRNSILFGLMGLIVTYAGAPLAERLLGLMTASTRRVLALAMVCVLAIDLAHTLASLLGLKKKLADLRATVDALRALDTAYDWYRPLDLPGSLERLRSLRDEGKVDARAAALLEQADAIAARRHGRRLLRAFPQMAHHDLDAELKALREAWKERRKKK